MGLAAWCLGLAALTFVFCLNMRLRGRLTQSIELVLTVGLLGMIGATFWLWGWRTGLLVCFGWFLVVGALRVLAFRLAAILLKDDAGSHRAAGAAHKAEISADTEND